MSQPHTRELKLNVLTKINEKVQVMTEIKQISLIQVLYIMIVYLLKFFLIYIYNCFLNIFNCLSMHKSKKKKFTVHLAQILHKMPPLQTFREKKQYRVTLTLLSAYLTNLANFISKDIQNQVLCTILTNIILDISNFSLSYIIEIACTPFF